MTALRQYGLLTQWQLRRQSALAHARQIGVQVRLRLRDVARVEVVAGHLAVAPRQVVVAVEDADRLAARRHRASQPPKRGAEGSVPATRGRRPAPHLLMWVNGTLPPAGWGATVWGTQ